MKKLFLSLALIVAATTTFAQTDPYTVTLAQAVWNFSDMNYYNLPTYKRGQIQGNSAYGYVPANWCVDNENKRKTVRGSSAYIPFICPNSSAIATNTTQFGMDGDLGLKFYHNPSNYKEFAILPRITDAAYTNLELEFYARKGVTSTETDYDSKLSIGYLVINDWANDTLNVIDNVVNLQSLDVVNGTEPNNYTKYTISLATVPANGRVVFYDATNANNIVYLDNISIRTKSGSTPEPEPEPEPEPTTYTITYNLTGCTGDAENPTTVEEGETYVNISLTANDGYTFDGAEFTITMGEVVFSDDYMDDYSYYFYDNTIYLTIGEDGPEDNIVVTIVAAEAAAKPVAPTTFTAATFEEFTIAENSVYRPSTLNVGDNWLISGGVVFSSRVEDWGGGYTGYSGIQVANYANGTATGSDAYLPAASAAAQGSNYATVNIMGLFAQIDFTTTTLSGLLINNTAFNIASFQNGDGYARPLAQGDWFKVTFTGLKDGVVTNSLDFYLADYRTAGAWTYVEDWTWVDLTALGQINALQFSLDGTDKGNFGLNTSAYFCIDNIGGTPTPTAIRNTTNSHVEKIVRDGQVFILRDGKIYTVQGHVVK